MGAVLDFISKLFGAAEKYFLGLSVACFLSVILKVNGFWYFSNIDADYIGPLLIIGTISFLLNLNNYLEWLKKKFYKIYEFFIIKPEREKNEKLKIIQKLDSAPMFSVYILSYLKKFNLKMFTAPCYNERLYDMVSFGFLDQDFQQGVTLNYYSVPDYVWHAVDSRIDAWNFKHNSAAPWSLNQYEFNKIMLDRQKSS